MFLGMNKMARRYIYEKNTRQVQEQIKEVRQMCSGMERVKTNLETNKEVMTCLGMNKTGETRQVQEWTE